jgi:hypothetical protein
MSTLTLPSFESYGQYASSNYGVNALVFADDRGRYWFSYRTMVAFQAWGRPRRVIRNYWGPTTGKHLNWIDDDHSSRLSEDEFKRAYAEDFA